MFTSRLFRNSLLGWYRGNGRTRICELEFEFWHNEMAYLLLGFRSYRSFSTYTHLSWGVQSRVWHLPLVKKLRFKQTKLLPITKLFLKSRTFVSYFSYFSISYQNKWKGREESLLGSEVISSEEAAGSFWMRKISFSDACLCTNSSDVCWRALSQYVERLVPQKPSTDGSHVNS